MTDKNYMAYWFPILQKSGVPVPETILVENPIGFDIYEPAWSGKKPSGWDDFVRSVSKAVITIASKHGFPVFLRSDLTSGKHSWKKTCCVPSIISMENHLIAVISDTGEIGGFDLPPIKCISVREMLPTEPAFTAFWGDLPICQERRYFFGDGKVIKHIPYWPEEELYAHHDDWRNKLMALNEESQSEIQALTLLAERVAQEFKPDDTWSMRLSPDNIWSLDFLATKRGWFAIDMALAKDSWGWE